MSEFLRSHPPKARAIVASVAAAIGSVTGAAACGPGGSEVQAATPRSAITESPTTIAPAPATTGAETTPALTTQPEQNAVPEGWQQVGGEIITASGERVIVVQEQGAPPLLVDANGLKTSIDGVQAAVLRAPESAYRTRAVQSLEAARQGKRFTTIRVITRPDTCLNANGQVVTAPQPQQWGDCRSLGTVTAIQGPDGEQQSTITLVRPPLELNQEYHDGTLGVNQASPKDLQAVFSKLYLSDLYAHSLILDGPTMNIATIGNEHSLFVHPVVRDLNLTAANVPPPFSLAPAA